MQPVTSLDDLAATFDLAHISRNPARFDPAELQQLSARTLHALPYPAVADRLAAAGVAAEVAEALWLAVRGNLERFDDVAIWWEVVSGTVPTTDKDPELLAAAAELLPPAPWSAALWTGEAWRAWTAALKARTGRKGRALFHPLRLALTGRDAGPELAALLPLIGPARAAARLAGRDA